jgi:hypothetical protein
LWLAPPSTTKQEIQKGNSAIDLQAQEVGSGSERDPPTFRLHRPEKPLDVEPLFFFLLLDF